MRQIRSLLLLFLLALAPAAAAQTNSPQAAASDEAAIRDLIGRWYEERRKGNEGRDFGLRAPGMIDASPGYTYRSYPPGMRPAVAGPRIYNSLAATALAFRHEISRLILDTRFAKVHVWERGYFYAAAAQRTYERLGSATFIVEKQEDGRWRVLAHQTGTMGIPPGMATDPMPDLRDLFYSTVGKDRDPDEDARNAARF